MVDGIGVVDPGAEPGGSTTYGAELAFDTRNKDVAFAGTYRPYRVKHTNANDNVASVAANDNFDVAVAMAKAA